MTVLYVALGGLGAALLVAAALTVSALRLRRQWRREDEEFARRAGQTLDRYLG